MNSITEKINFSIPRLNLSHCKEVSLPVDVPPQHLKLKLKETIMNGEYNLGELIVPQVFQKTIIKENKIIQEEFSVEGRKIPLFDICKKMFDQHKT